MICAKNVQDSKVQNVHCPSSRAPSPWLYMATNSIQSPHKLHFFPLPRKCKTGYILHKMAGVPSALYLRGKDKCPYLKAARENIVRSIKSKYKI